LFDLIFGEGDPFDESPRTRLITHLWINERPIECLRPGPFTPRPLTQHCAGGKMGVIAGQDRTLIANRFAALVG
jgi:hypothetical protein